MTRSVLEGVSSAHHLVAPQPAECYTISASPLDYRTPIRDWECSWALSRPILHPHRGRSSQPPGSKLPRKLSGAVVVLLCLI